MLAQLYVPFPVHSLVVFKYDRPVLPTISTRNAALMWRVASKSNRINPNDDTPSIQLYNGREAVGVNVERWDAAEGAARELPAGAGAQGLVPIQSP